MPEGNLASDFPEKYKLLQDKFTSPSENSEAGTVEFTRDFLSIPLDDIDSTLAPYPYNEFQMIFPFTFFHYRFGQLNVENGNWIRRSYIISDDLIEVYQFRFSFIEETVGSPFYSAELNFGPLPI